MSVQSVGAVGIDLILKGGKYEQQLAALQSKSNLASNRISSSFKKIGTAVAAGLSVRAIVRFGKECINLGSNLAEVQNVVDVTFSTMNTKLNTWAKNAAASYGLSETMAKKFAGLYGTMAKSSGLSEKAAYDMSTALTELAGDVASFYNMNHEEAYTKLKAVFSGETEVLKDIGVVMTQDALNSYALANGINKTVQHMTQAEKVALRYEFILNQLSAAQGDFTRTQDNWANQVRVLQLRFDSLKATIGQGLINALTPTLKVVNKLIERAQVLADSFSSAMAAIFGVSSNTSNAVASTVAAEQELTESAEDSASSVDKVTDSINNSAKAAKGSVASFDKLNLLSTSDETDNSSLSSVQSSSTAPVVFHGENLSDKSAVFWDAYTQKILDSANITFSKIKTAVLDIKDAWNNVWKSDKGRGLLNNIKQLTSHIIDNIGYIAEHFSKAWTNASLGEGVIDSIIDRVDSLIGLIDVVSESFSEAWNNGTGEIIWENILNIIKNCNDYIATWRDKLKEAWSKNDTGMRIWESILGIVETITGLFKELSQVRLNWVEDLDLSPMLESVQSLVEAFKELFDACGEHFKGLYEDVLLPLAKWTIEKAVPVLVETLANVLSFFAKVIKIFPTNLLSGIAAGVATFVATLKAVQIVNKVKGYLKTLGSSFSGVFTKLKSFISTNPYAAAFMAIATAIAAVTTAISVYSKQKWDNSSLKKQIDEVESYTEKINECADAMKQTREEFENAELEVQADFTQVDELKSKLQEMISDGTIDENEMATYKTVVDLLKEKVDGFEDYWNGLELSEVEGKIQLNPDVETVAQDIDTVIDKWKELQLSQLYTNIINTLGTEKVTLKIDCEIAENNVKTTKKALLEYIRKHDFSVFSEVASADDFVKAYQEGNVRFGLSKSEGEDLIKAYVNAKKSLSEYNYETQEQSKAYDDAMNKLEALNGSTTNYAGILGLVEDGLWSEEQAFERLKGTGIITMAQLQTKAMAFEEKQRIASESVDDTSDSMNEMGDTAQVNSQKASQASDDFKNNSQKNIHAIETGYSDGFSKIGTKAQELWDKLNRVFGNNIHIGESLKNIFKNSLNYLIDGINELMSNVASFINNQFSSIRNWEVFGSTPFGWLPQFTAPQIPRFAKGAIVKAPTLAVVGDNPGAGNGDPEVISPLSKLQSMMNTSNGQDLVILTQMLDYLKRIYEMFVVFRNEGGNLYQFMAILNGEVLFQEMIKQNELYKKRTGESAF